MRTLIALLFFIWMVKADSSTSQDVKQKTQTPLQPQVFHPQMRYYHPSLQSYAQPQYVQVVQKPFYMPPQQPHAMIIIAQPAFVPQSLLYGGAPQQLLNYIHNNPQAKYQQAQLVPQPTVGNYIIAVPPQYPVYGIPQTSPTQLHPQANHPQQIQSLIQSQQIQPLQPQQTQPILSQSIQSSQIQIPQHQTNRGIAQLAQLVAQQYAKTPLKAAPAFITGFENFTPEQQSQIKAQLGAHLGTNYQILPGLKKDEHQQQQQGQQKQNEPNPQKYSSDYSAPKFGDFTQKFSEFSSQKFQDFVPSQPVKSEVTTTPGDILKTQYTKG